VGDIALLDESKDVGATNRRHLAALYCGTNSGFEVQFLKLLSFISNTVWNSFHCKFWTLIIRSPISSLILFLVYSFLILISCPPSKIWQFDFLIWRHVFAFTKHYSNSCAFVQPFSSPRIQVWFCEYVKGPKCNFSNCWEASVFLARIRKHKVSHA
jgi:hypothetical protein